MKRSNNKQKEMTAALYVRLSRDDNLEGDSYSIGNQKKLLTKIAKNKGDFSPYKRIRDIMRLYRINRVLYGVLKAPRIILRQDFKLFYNTIN